MVLRISITWQSLWLYRCGPRGQLVSASPFRQYCLVRMEHQYGLYQARLKHPSSWNWITLAVMHSCLCSFRSVVFLVGMLFTQPYPSFVTRFQPSLVLECQPSLVVNIIGLFMGKNSMAQRLNVALLQGTIYGNYPRTQLYCIYESLGCLLQGNLKE